MDVSTRPSQAIPSRLLRALGGVGDELALNGPSPEALDRIVRAISNEFGYQRVAVYLLREEGFQKTSHVGYETCHLDPTIGVVARALATRQPQFVPDVSLDRDYVPADDGVISEICVPLIERSETLGVLNVETIAPLRLNRDDLAFIRAIADRVTAAVVLARDRGDLAHRVDLLDRLAAASTRIAESVMPGRVRDGVLAAAEALIDDAEARLRLSGSVDVLRDPLHKVGVVKDEHSPESNRDCASVTSAGHQMQIPLQTGGRLYGCLWWRRQSRGPFSVVEQQVADLLAGQATLALATASTHAALAALAETDALTELPNRRYFERAVNLRPDRVTSGGRTPTSVLVLDLDQFGLINKRHGHAVGDAVLKGFAAILRDALRETDIVARTGGEEFIAVLDATAESSAVIVANRIREAFSAWSLPLADGTELTTTVSIGLASSDVATTQTLVEAADRALGDAKQSGRNRVAVSVPRVSR